MRRPKPCQQSPPAAVLRSPVCSLTSVVSTRVSEPQELLQRELTPPRCGPSVDESTISTAKLIVASMFVHPHFGGDHRRRASVVPEGMLHCGERAQTRTGLGQRTKSLPR